MPITIAQGSPQNVWVPITDGVTLYVGGIVCVDRSAPGEGVMVLPDASGAANVTNNDVPYGVVIGTNLKNPTYDTTYKCDKIVNVGVADPHDGSANEYVGVEGPYSKGDQIGMVKVAIITPSTVLKASIFKAAVGTPLPRQRPRYPRLRLVSGQHLSKTPQ